MCQGWGLSPFTVALDANLTEGVNMLYVSSEQPIGQNARFVGACPLYSWHFVKLALCYGKHSVCTMTHTLCSMFHVPFFYVTCSWVCDLMFDICKYF